MDYVLFDSKLFMSFYGYHFQSVWVVYFSSGFHTYYFLNSLL